MENKKLNKEQLEMLGIYSVESKLYPNRHFVPHVGQVDLHEDVTVSGILQMIWFAGNKYGQEQGKQMKANEIKKALLIDED